MNISYLRTFLNGIFIFFLSSSVAMADNAEEMDRANDYYDKQEMTNAAELYKKLAKQNYLPAMTRLADLYDYSELHEVATGWYIMAAFQGEPGGAFGLARAYANGTGIKKDPDQALYWYKFSADKGNFNAVTVLEKAYRVGEKSGLPVPADTKQADYWRTKQIALDAIITKEENAKVEAERKKREQKAAEIKKADEEAALKAKQGK